jgi:hypothetical protein
MSENTVLGKDYWAKKAKTGKLTSEEKLRLAETLAHLFQIGYIGDPEELSEIFGVKLTYRKDVVAKK